MSSMLLYFYMIHIALVLSFATHACISLCNLYIHAPDSTIFLIYYTNFLIVFVLSRDIFYLCSIYAAKIIKFVQWIYYKRTKEKAWHALQTFTYTISLYKYYTSKQLFCLYFLFFFMFLYTTQSFATSDFVAMQVKTNIKIFSKKHWQWDYTGV